MMRQRGYMHPKLMIDLVLIGGTVLGVGGFVAAQELSATVRVEAIMTFIMVTLFAIIGWFVRDAVRRVAEDLKEHDKKIAEFRVEALGRVDAIRGELRENERWTQEQLKTLFAALAAIEKQIARLDTEQVHLKKNLESSRRRGGAA